MSTLSQVSLLEVWRALGGPEPHRGRACAWWRESRDSNVSVSTERGVFYDHVQNRGGGVLALVETVLSCGRATALTWLESEGFIEPRRLTYEQGREHARRKSDASSAALDIARWRSTFILELNKRKVTAVQTGADVALDHAASLCNLLENGSPVDIVREFIRQRMADPEIVAQLVALGEERDDEARRTTAESVLLLGSIEMKGL